MKGGDSLRPPPPTIRRSISFAQGNKLAIEVLSLRLAAWEIHAGAVAAIPQGGIAKWRGRPRSDRDAASTLRQFPSKKPKEQSLCPVTAAQSIPQVAMCWLF